MSAVKKNCVVVPFDFGEMSLKAVDIALEYVDDPSKVHIVHVLEPLASTDPGVMWHTIDDATRKRNVQENLSTKFNQPQYQGVQTIIPIGHIVEEIIDYSKESQADLIVIPTHGRRGISRFMLGSVAERVIRFADCPVLVLR